MDLKTMAVVFGAVFLAELGDKTQIATLLFAADKDVSKWTIFAGAGLALLATTAIAVAAGGVLAQYVSPRALNIAAGIGFVVIGAWTLLRA